MLRSDSNLAPHFLAMLKGFKVPVGLNEEETKQFEEYFSKNKSWFRSKQEDIYNDHSKVIYLMSPDN